MRLHIIEQQFQNRLQRKQAEHEVRQQRAFLEHILESLPDPFYVIDPKTYTVSRGGLLRWVTTEEVAVALYGPDWNTMIDDVSDAFFFGYTIGDPITMDDI